MKSAGNYSYWKEKPS